MNIQHNIAAMNTHRQLGSISGRLAKSTEKLSSGFRINRAADDPAGLMISEKMRAQIRGLNRAALNAQDGISLIQAAEGALQESHNILQRMREIAVQAANDVMEDEDREAIQKELDMLTAEIDRIAYTTEFNKKALLSGSLSNGKYSDIISGTGFSAANISQSATLGQYVVRMETSAQAAVYSAVVDQQTPGVIGAGVISIGGLYDSAGMTLDYAVSEQEIQSGSRDELMNNIAAKINLDKDSKYTASFDSGVLIFTAKEAQATNSADAPTKQFDPTVTATAGVGLTAEPVNTDIVGTNATFTASAVDKVGNAIAIGYASYNINTGYVDIGTDSQNIYLSMRINETKKYSAASVKMEQGSSLYLQIGANTGSSNAMKIGIGNMSAGSLNITGLDVSNHINAQGAVEKIEHALKEVSAQRSYMGAMQNALEHRVASLETTAENLQNAESRIRDVDMAKEMMEYTKLTILQQSAIAMLAQANQMPKMILRLLE